MNRPILFALCALFFVPGSSQATTVTFFTDRNVFENLLSSSSTTIDFETGIGDNGKIFGSELSFNGVNFIADGYSGSSNELMWSGKNVFGSSGATPMESALLVVNYSYPIIADLTTAGSGFNAVGGFFGDISAPLDTITLELFGVSGLLETRNLLSASMLENTPSNFFGWIVEGEEIVSIRYSLNGNYEGIDDFVFGVAVAVAVVPVPATVWLFSSALGLLGWIKRQT